MRDENGKVILFDYTRFKRHAHATNYGSRMTFDENDMCRAISGASLLPTHIYRPGAKP